MLLRIILGEDNIKKVHLDKLPDTIEDFCDFLKTELGLSGEIIIQHQDPDFNMELYNLNSMLDLPRDKATLKDEPLVADVLKRWPALYFVRQLEYEFARLTAVNLRETLITGIDKYLDRFLELFRAKRAIPGLSSLIRQLDNSDNSTHFKRAILLLGLPHFLRDDCSSFVKTVEATDDEKSMTKGIKVGLLILKDGEDIIDVSVVLEESVILKDLGDIPTAMAQCSWGFFTV
uniref:Uncharacterized protein n=1 Tax=Knipowitschia caucasica TaxID=637954 RepID=A0AAV2J8P2_KNICA